jgi:hypothetical protein
MHLNTLKPLAIIRPYSQKIRARITAALRLVGYDIEGAFVLPRGTTDREVLSELSSRPAPRGLLIPFHAQEDAQGNHTDGLSLLLELRRSLPWFVGIPAVMPVSQVGHAGYLLRAKALNAQRLPAYLAVFEPELDDTPALAARLRATGF